MKIISWNLYNLFDAEKFLKENIFSNLNDAEIYIANRRKYYIEEIKKINPDLCYFYEVISVNELREIFNQIFTDGFEIFTTTPDTRGSCNALVYPTSLKNRIAPSEFFLDELEIPSFVISEVSFKHKHLVQKRGYIKTNLKSLDNLIDLEIFATHLKSQLPTRILNNDRSEHAPINSDEAARSQYLGEIIGLAESYGLRKIFTNEINQNKNIIMIGDFNCDTKSRRMHILRGLEKSNDELKDIFPVSGNINYTYIYKQEKIRLDHILANSSFVSKIKNSLTINKDLKEEEKPQNVWHDTNIIGSDHACIYFELEGF